MVKNELTSYSQFENTTEETQSSFKNFKTSAAVIVTVVVLSASSQITTVIHDNDESNGVNVENTHDSAQVFYNEGLSDAHVHYLESISQSVDEYHIITEVKPMKNIAYGNLMSYVHFMNVIGWIMGTGLLFVGLFIFRLPIVISILISSGGFILPILTRISGVYKYAGK
ncbi:hypothetical protein [Lactiplantibacillus plantarum]|uniref:hypothetical protein n=1 Tax=Lactiplantibacillus plantarum TaxID=1590 RepID=UPI00216616B7|nr:hypothetical protein [Lactiplantibacillus plantarum]UVW05499.1 hypothetical protein NX849_12530 [Lactiplantibacillus plantarum]UWF35671.1 hypothetical protein NYR24_12530 [Lactiplantibacillus plantarum]